MCIAILKKSFMLPGHVTQHKVMEIFYLIAIEEGENKFVTSEDWVTKFLECNGLTLRRLTTVCQNPPADYANKILFFLFMLSHCLKSLISLITPSLNAKKPQYGMRHYRILPLPQKVPKKLPYVQPGIAKIALVTVRRELELNWIHIFRFLETTFARPYQAVWSLSSYKIWRMNQELTEDYLDMICWPSNIYFQTFNGLG